MRQHTLVCSTPLYSKWFEPLSVMANTQSTLSSWFVPIEAAMMVVAKERAGRMVEEAMQRAMEAEENEREPLKVSPIPVEPVMYYYSYLGSVKKNLFDNREPGDLSVVHSSHGTMWLVRGLRLHGEIVFTPAKSSTE